ncbi:MAG: zf-HC2 domain-containing protein, partial [Fibrobacteria bacterium]
MDMHLDGDRICDLAEGALDPAQRAEAEAHVKGCADCRRELEAARAYLRDLSDLTAVDPVKAPPNFLASVRARLPQPSPMKRLWDGFLRPFRVIPMQVALLTVLGLTAISSYLYQRGGLHESPSMVAVNPASADSEPPSPQPEPSPGLAANKEAELISALPKRKGHSRQLAAVPDAVSGNAAGSGASVGRISPVHPAKPAAP